MAGSDNDASQAFWDLEQHIKEANVSPELQSEMRSVFVGLSNRIYHLEHWVSLLLIAGELKTKRARELRKVIRDSHMRPWWSPKTHKPYCKLPCSGACKDR